MSQIYFRLTNVLKIHLNILTQMLMFLWRTKKKLCSILLMRGMVNCSALVSIYVQTMVGN